MHYKKYDTFFSPTPEPVVQPIITQPDACLTLREILIRFSNGDNSVLSHVPVDDHVDKMTDDEFFNDDTFDVPISADDDLQSQEFIIQQRENKSFLDKLSKEKDKEQKEQEDGKEVIE